MASLDNARLALVDGVAIDVADNRVYLAAGFSGIDLAASRLLLLSSRSEWMSHDVKTRIVSVDVNRSPLQFFALGRDGFVSVATNTETHEERIPDAGTGRGKIGYVAQLRVIGDRVYVCGDLNQVYRRDVSGWTHIDSEILVKDPLAIGRGLNSIDGTAANNIYAVGDRGVILYYDGKHWQDTASPTNCSLERVRCVSRDDVFICGAKGTLLRGNRSRWQVIGDEFPIEEDFWALEYFQGKLYFATLTRLFEWSDGKLHDLNRVLGVSIKGHRLTATEKSLWCVGANSLFCFDGREWNTVTYPGS